MSEDGKNEVDWQPSVTSDPFATCVDRRTFMRGGAALVGGVALSGPLSLLRARSAQACGPIVSPYGPIAPKVDENTGLELIQLPDGFRYWSFGWTGDSLSDGTPTPALHDGMAVVKEMGSSGRLILCRNHEVGGGVPAFAEGPFRYSPDAGGGNVNLVWNTATQKLERSWPSLSGTFRNCAGGLTPWASWLSCEETIETTAGGAFKHGYVFDVHADGKGRNNGRPFRAMGRFSHEAVAVDPTSGIVYETEDGPTVDSDAGSGLYRYVPNSPGRLENGRLQMLKVVGQTNKDLQTLGCDGAETVFDVEWVDVPNPDPDFEAGAASCFQQGFDRGAAVFRRLEGIWYGDGKLYFNSTTGGPISEGQVWVYDPREERLEIIFHSAAQADCENPDNIVVTPRGALILCEDNSGSTSNDGERMLGLTAAGEVFTFAKNNLNFTGSGLGTYHREESGISHNGDFRQQEWAGACFSGDGQWLFANIQTPGITFAITGPWEAGPL